MKYKNLGNTTVKIPAIGQGSTGTGGYANYDQDRIKARIEVMRAGVELGLSYIDTGDLYGGGLAEEVVGKTIKGIREKVFLASKFNPVVPARESILQSIEGSLRRLRTDYIDLYQMHWPNPTISIAEVMEVLSELVAQGKIRFIGLSNFSVDGFEEAQSFVPREKIVSNQAEYNLMDRSVEENLIPFCKENSVTLLAYSPLNKGRIFHSPDQYQLLKDLAQKYQKTISQIVLRWLIINDPVVVITKSGDLGRTIQNSAAADFGIEQDDIDRIDRSNGKCVTDVPIGEIRLDVSRNSEVYTNLSDAVANHLDLIPSPAVLAEILLQTSKFKPIRLVPNSVSSQQYRYDIDHYDIWDNVKRYWAWVIAFGEEKPIPAYILDRID